MVIGRLWSAGGLPTLGVLIGALAAVPAALDGVSAQVLAVMAVVVAGQSAALALVHRRSLLVMCLAWVGAVGLALVVPYAGTLGAANVAVAGVARWRPPQVSVVGLAAMLVLAPWNLRSGGPAQMLLAVFAAGLAWTIGALVRVDAGRRTDQLERVVAQERAAVAREVHDVLAHGLTVVSVHCNAALDVFDTRPDLARRSLQTIDTAARGALADLRRVLAAVGSEAPVRGAGDLDGLDALADTVRAGGLRVVLNRAGGPLDGDDGVWIGTTAYRIVQEALTNVARHARAGQVEVSILVEGDAVRVVVEDDGVGPGRSGQATGRGLIGMAERAAVLGGTVSAGPGRAGGFRVEAKLPRARPG